MYSDMHEFRLKLDSIVLAIIRYTHEEFSANDDFVVSFRIFSDCFAVFSELEAVFC